jgi:hypothetical protein
MHWQMRLLGLQRRPFHGGIFFSYDLNHHLIRAKGFARDIATAQQDWKGTTNGDWLTDHAAEYIAGIWFEAGADTSRNMLQGFVKVPYPMFLLSFCSLTKEF